MYLSSVHGNLWETNALSCKFCIECATDQWEYMYYTNHRLPQLCAVKWWEQTVRILNVLVVVL